VALVRLQETYRSVESRMAQESLRRHVLRVLRVWRSWFIFSDDFLNGLQVHFLCFA
jgi:U2-associated protein SR140